MGHVLGDVLGVAAAVAVSPLPIIAVILILATPRGRLNGILFTFGWILGLSALGAVMLVIASPAGASSHGHPAAWAGALKLALGLFLLLFGARRWHRRPRDPSQARLPKWMGAIDRLTPVKVFALGLALAALNAKNAPLTIAAGATIGSAGLPVGQEIASLAVFVVIATCGLLAPLAVFLLGGERAKATLGNWKEWAAQHNVAVMAVLFFVLGLKLFGDGISILVS
ncbi:GAP family protein [Streptomyces sp. SID8366]|uniref:GAP family protein n=1 Tax=unclassified Streptomyces TaxID=2593676 RepID=UPI000DBA8839|nr:GAP family protein [Streptomyces sp. PsTaAH-130]MYU02568.1 GAP family protein [Streptomyces sp. SID8366]MYU62935.1 GAP family protein [Streptomyces sp. SID69]RAJ48651.1 Sap-like sulfolipid-1-addressing protein [Streptomyces sp. PsTaAH-130]